MSAADSEEVGCPEPASVVLVMIPLRMLLARASRSAIDGVAGTGGPSRCTPTAGQERLLTRAVENTAPSTSGKGEGELFPEDPKGRQRAQHATPSLRERPFTQRGGKGEETTFPAASRAAG